MAPRMKVETSESQQPAQPASGVASTAAPKAQVAQANPPASAPKPQVSVPKASVEPAQQSPSQAAPAKKTVSARVVPSVETPAAEPPTRTATSASARQPRHVALKATVDISSTTETTESTAQRPASAPKHAAAPKPKVNVRQDEAASEAQPRQEDGWEYGERARSVYEDSYSRTEMPSENVTSQGTVSQERVAQPKQRAGKTGVSRNFFQTISEWVHRTFPGHVHAFMGGVIAFFVAVLMIAIGPLYSIVIFLVVLVGVAIGQYLDGDPKIVRMVSGLFNGDRDQR